MLVFAFDRDWTVDVNPHPRHEAVPLSWVRHLAHETDHAVYAIGNQDLAEEGAIPGVVDIVGRHDDNWDEWLGGKRPDGRYERFPDRRERLALIADLHPDATGYVVVDDLDLGDVEGWDHYHAWEFVPAVKRGDVDPSLPWVGERVADGGRPRSSGNSGNQPANGDSDHTQSAGIAPAGPDHLREFLDETENAPGYEITYEGKGGKRTRVLADLELRQRTLDRPAAAPAVTCVPASAVADSFTVRVDAIACLSVVEPPREAFTAGAEAPAQQAVGLRRLAQSRPDAVAVPSLLVLLEDEEQSVRADALEALRAVARARPVDCRPALPVLRSLLAGESLERPTRALATLHAIAAESPADVAPLVDVVTPYLTDEGSTNRTLAAKCLMEVVDESPADLVDAVPELATLVADGGEGQSYAVYVLNCVARVDPDAVEPVAGTIAEQVVDDDLSESKRLNATAALGRVVDANPGVGPDILDDVVPLLDADSNKLRANAAALASDLSKHTTIDLRPHLDRFLALLTDEDDFCRVNASATVSRIARDFPVEVAPAVETLVGLLDDDHELVRLNACWALGHLGARATEALPALEALRKRETDEQVLVRAQWAIAEIEM